MWTVVVQDVACAQAGIGCTSAMRLVRVGLIICIEPLLIPDPGHGLVLDCNGKYVVLHIGKIGTWILIALNDLSNRRSHEAQRQRRKRQV